MTRGTYSADRFRAQKIHTVLYVDRQVILEADVVGMARPLITKERKKHDRFNGMSEEEVSKRTLPDHLASNLDIIIVSVISV